MLWPKERGMGSRKAEAGLMAIVSRLAPSVGRSSVVVASENRMFGEKRIIICCNSALRTTSAEVASAVGIIVLAMAGAIIRIKKLKNSQTAIEDSSEVAILRNTTEKSIAKPIQKAP